MMAVVAVCVIALLMCGSVTASENDRLLVSGTTGIVQRHSVGSERQFLAASQDGGVLAALGLIVLGTVTLGASLAFALNDPPPPSTTTTTTTTTTTKRPTTTTKMAKGRMMPEYDYDQGW